MKKKNLQKLFLFLTVLFFTGRSVSAQDVDLTSLIVNNNFDYVAADISWSSDAATRTTTFPKYPNTANVSSHISNAWRPYDNGYTIDKKLDFYGWSLSDWTWLFSGTGSTTQSNSIGINGGTTSTDGSCAWISGNYNSKMPNDFAFYQVIDGLGAGTYKVTCLMGVQDGYLTTQRLFANNNVQFYGKEEYYGDNKTVGEIYSYAGNAAAGADNLKALKLYITILDGEPLKLGIRSGKDGIATGTSNIRGWFKMDKFTLTKMDIDPVMVSDATLSSITLSAGTITDFSPATKTYSVTLPMGTTTVKPTVVTNFEGATVTGTGMVSLNSVTGTATSTIEVTAVDGTTTETYTINYTHAANDYSYKITNSDFDWVTSTVPYSSTGVNYPNLPDGTTSLDGTTFRTIKNGFNRGTGAIQHLDFHGWELTDWDFLFNDNTGTAITVVANSPRIQKGTTGVNGESSIYITGLGKCVVPEDFRFHQTISGLDAGVYKVTCLMGAGGSRYTSQRLFAQTPTQHKVQFYGKSADYTAAFTTNIDNEIRAYAGHDGTTDAGLKPMEVYIVVKNGEPLDLGIRSGNMRKDGTKGNNVDPSMYGCFHADNFTLTKVVDPAILSNATLSSLTVSAGTLSPVFAPATTTYEAIVPVGTTSVTPTAVPELGSITSGAEKVDLTLGLGVVGTSVIVVTALDGTTTETYTINYKYASVDPADAADATLSSLTIDAGTLSPAFSPATTNYSVTLPEGMTSVTPTAVCNFIGARTTGAGTTFLNPSTGLATSSIVVAALDGTTTNTYTITYNRSGENDYSYKIINNDFNLAPDVNGNPVGMSFLVNGVSDGYNGSWRPTLSTGKQFYGWTFTAGGTSGFGGNTNATATLGNTSQGINTDAGNKNGTYIAWIYGWAIFPEFCEFSQTISGLPVGTYKLQARLAVDLTSHLTTQRLFANDKVQYYGEASKYVSNLTAGEINTFAGYTAQAANELKEMSVYANVAVDGNLKLGVRTGGKKSDGSYQAAILTTGASFGSFKMDYFRLSKLDAATAANVTNSKLSSITLSVGSLSFDPEITTYNNVLLPLGTTSVTPTVVKSSPDATVTGDGEVTLVSGKATSEIVVTALDGTKTTYTINYVDTPTALNYVNTAKATYSVVNGKLTVEGADAYQVYGINGVKVADAKSSESVNLATGIYVVKTTNGEVFKVIVK